MSQPTAPTASSTTTRVAIPVPTTETEGVGPRCGVSVTRMEESKLRKKFGELPNRSHLLMKQIKKDRKFFDSADQAMAAAGDKEAEPGFISPLHHSPRSSPLSSPRISPHGSPHVSPPRLPTGGRPSSNS
eukprot:gnl/Hemi2/8285_TR2856_c0_g1_i1.p1 gnl/Hemi2/8285_TR2856_c0_g1~~gnl/Hemi2/8285_TR2856_c0_g1_i1.p1  ORF type:complete len:130 (-),score=30.81 gnl/Hemi2/8285_TR2856_c0_g1_i1:190-579(-)